MKAQAQAQAETRTVSTAQSSCPLLPSPGGPTSAEPRKAGKVCCSCPAKSPWPVGTRDPPVSQQHMCRTVPGLQPQTAGSKCFPLWLQGQAGCICPGPPCAHWVLTQGRGPAPSMASLSSPHEAQSWGVAARCPMAVTQCARGCWASHQQRLLQLPVQVNNPNPTSEEMGTFGSDRNSRLWPNGNEGVQ